MISFILIIYYISSALFLIEILVNVINSVYLLDIKYERRILAQVFFALTGLLIISISTTMEEEYGYYICLLGVIFTGSGTSLGINTFLGT